ncbi:MAG: sigma-70 family RNA polymerase sigma factor [Gammaproteobacteria bacterium]|jgi:RNA polymerase sigma-70 factor, ECF subfamily|nr:sigma-70 family RNA polymerase sigma factor [Gammaproteobacteria bacterium]MBT7603508.1 sigma-70 family RNA polymerase sigma factor [Gammaproteobacteria bacterium]
MNSSKDKKLSELFIKAQNGNDLAYELFLMETAKILKSFLNKRMNSSSNAEDVLQETLLSIHNSRHTYLSSKPVGPWLYAICKNRMIDYHRKQSRFEKFITVDSVKSEKFEILAEINCNEEESEKGIQIIECLNKLPKAQKKIIKLLKIDGFSVKEVAMKTGMSESSVKVTASRGYKKIREMFGVK